MDRKIILNEIVSLQETIAEQTETIINYNDSIPQIEIDIILSNIRSLYEKFYEINKTNKPGIIIEKNEKQIQVTKEKIVKPVIEEQPPVTEKEIAEFEKNMLIDSMAQYTMLSESITEEKKSEKTEEIEFPQKKIKQQKKSSPDLFSDDNTIADKFKDEKKSLNEVLSDKTSDISLASRLQKNQIKDLKSAIGINEKFMLINELFEGSLQKYNENINSLNSFTDKAEAMKFVEGLKKEFSWKENSEAYIMITDLVSRKYL